MIHSKGDTYVPPLLSGGRDSHSAVLRTSHGCHFTPSPWRPHARSPGCRTASPCGRDCPTGRFSIRPASADFVLLRLPRPGFLIGSQQPPVTSYVRDRRPLASFIRGRGDTFVTPLFSGGRDSYSAALHTRHGCHSTLHPGDRLRGHQGDSAICSLQNYTLLAPFLPFFSGPQKKSNQTCPPSEVNMKGGEIT